MVVIFYGDQSNRAVKVSDLADEFLGPRNKKYCQNSVKILEDTTGALYICGRLIANLSAFVIVVRMLASIAKAESIYSSGIVYFTASLWVAAA